MLSRQPLRSSTGFPAQGDSEAGRVLEGQVLASVLTMHGGASRTADSDCSRTDPSCRRNALWVGLLALYWFI
jgi:hypothetical protein